MKKADFHCSLPDNKHVGYDNQADHHQAGNYYVHNLLTFQILILTHATSREAKLSTELLYPDRPWNDPFSQIPHFPVTWLRDPILLDWCWLHTIEHMGEDLQSRLRRLGVLKGARQIKPAADRHPLFPAAESQRSESDDPPPLTQLLPGGYLAQGDDGACYVVDRVYPLQYWHGRDRLGDLLNQPPPVISDLTQDHRLGKIPVDDYLFLDTETTGLGGAGTLAFMVGVAFFEAGALIVRQYFLRDHGDEPAMLSFLAELLAQKEALVTFNGRSFDLPLLDNRYLMNRMDNLAGDLLERPHLDLLPPSRRLWRYRIGSCALGSLEQQLLGVTRSQEDVPGWAIPGLYLDYLRSGDARPLLRVFYHNQIDMLSMVTLASRVMRQFARPSPEDHPLDLFSLARWQLALDMPNEAEANLRLAAAGDLPLEDYHQVLYQLAGMLKRAERRSEAVQLWQQIAVTAFDDVTAHVELAKQYEWHEVDLATARFWTQEALTLSTRWSRRGSEATRAQLIQAELAHRLARLDRKLTGISDEEGEAD